VRNEEIAPAWQLAVGAISFASSGEFVGDFATSARRLAEESVELPAGGIEGTL
jgi:hypothetical protein